MTSFFVALEGIDNAGKTTFLTRADSEFSRYLNVRCTRELTSLVGPSIKRGLSDGALKPPDKVLLFAADRQLRISDGFLCTEPDVPSLFLADRWVLSALAYRCAEDSALESYVRDVNRIFPGPDLTILIDITPEESILRGTPVSKNTYPLSYLHDVRRQYLRLCNGPGFVIIDGMRNEGIVWDEVRSIISAQLQRRGLTVDQG